MTAMPITVDRSEGSAPSVATDRPATRVTRATRPVARPGRSDGRAHGPRTRPTRSLRVVTARTSARACSPGPMPTATAQARAAWRLTDRGIAVVLVTAAMIAVAALVVIGLTAVRVTSDGYVTAGQSGPGVGSAGTVTSTR